MAPLCKGPRSVGAVVNDMPVAYQSRAVTEPQRELSAARLTEGLLIICHLTGYSINPSGASRHLPLHRGGFEAVPRAGTGNNESAGSFW